MEKHGDEVRESTTEARAAVNVKGMVTVLAVSLALVIVAFAALYLL